MSIARKVLSTVFRLSDQPEVGRHPQGPPVQKTVEDTPTGAHQFDEKSYLERYSDVAAALRNGDYPSGWAHFDLFGRAEGRIGTPIVAPEGADLDPASCIMRIPSPALLTKPPVVVNADLIPGETRSMYASLWQHQQPAGELACHVLQDVIVVGAGLVFDRVGRIIAASTHQTSAAQIEDAALKVSDLLEKGGGDALSGTTLLCEKVGVGNFGHWLVEMAPIAFLLRERLEREWFVRAPMIDGSSSMSVVIRDTLDLLGVDPARIRWAADNRPQRYERLVMTQGFSQHGAAYSPLASLSFEAMAKQVLAEKPSRIWVSRAGMRRRMQDEDGICDALAARGWRIVSPETMSLRAQIALFKDAEIVAGTSGAGLTNFAFAPASTRIIAFVPAGMPDIFFWKVAQMKGQSYTEVRCRQEHPPAGAFNWEGMLMMETDRVLAHLDAILVT